MSGNAGLHVQATCFNRRGVHVLGHGTRRPASCFNSKGVVSHGRGGCSRRMGGRSVTHARTDGRTDGVRWTVTYRDAAHGRTAVAVAQQGVAGAGPRRRILWRPGCVSNKHVRWSMLFNQATATDTDSLDHAARLQANQVSAMRMINTKYLPKQKSEWREQGARKTFVSTAFLCGCVFALRRLREKKKTRRVIGPVRPGCCRLLVRRETAQPV
jgi:hypothetical protein